MLFRSGDLYERSITGKTSGCSRYAEEEKRRILNNRTEDFQPCLVVEKAQDILKKIEADTEVVAIDEVQFFDKDIVEVCEYLADKGIRVMVAGLDKDFRGESFGVMPELLTRAEFVTKLTAVCAKCGAPATRTQRLVNGKPAGFEDPIVMVGADESYEPRCRHCHQVPNKPHKF